MMNARLVPDPPAVLTPGEAVAGMMLKGLGFANRPVSLTPPFLASTPRDLWWHDGVRAEMCNRFKRGRTLDAAEADGGDLRWQELARCVCARAGIELRFNHLDTTRCARRGEDIPERDAQAMTITHGDARAHRPDLKPVVLALRGAHDGGLPCGRQRWDGKTSDRAVFQARAQAWLAAFQPAPHPRARLADAKLYHEEHATHLRHLGCIPRLPNTRRSVSEAITHALAWDCWPRLEAHTREQRLELGHDGMAQRWLVVYAQAAYARAAATLHHARPRDDEAIHTPLLPFHARRFATPEAAPAALTAVAKGWTYHQLDSDHLTDHQRDARHGRPTPSRPITARDWPIQAHVRPAEAASEPHTHRHACGVIGTHLGTSEWPDPEGITASKRQSQVDGGFRCLNDPRLCVSSW